MISLGCTLLYSSDESSLYSVHMCGLLGHTHDYDSPAAARNETLQALQIQCTVARARLQAARGIP